MADHTLIYMALQRLPELGPAREARLFEHFKSLQELLAAGSDAWRGAGLAEESVTALKQLSAQGEDSPWVEQIRRDYDHCQQQGWQLISRECANYPALLLETATPPPLLYAHGDVKLLQHTQVAMVGARKSSRSGCEMAAGFAADLASAGLLITSGLALGIDSACHQAALDSGGKTIAVLGSGLGRVYPARNRKLAEAITENGCLLSEFPPFTAPLPGNFPQRNRIISGLSRALIVVEAASRSGSLITARYALEQNREVFAVPGSVNNPLSAGCNELIKSGASLLNSAEDLIEQLEPISVLDTARDQQPEQVLAGFSEQDQAMARQLASVLHHVAYEPTSMDAIRAGSGQSAAELSAALVELQLLGRIESRAGRYIRLR